MWCMHGGSKGQAASFVASDTFESCLTQDRHPGEPKYLSCPLEGSACNIVVLEDNKPLT